MNPKSNFSARGALRIGTRGSPLAIAQAGIARERVLHAAGLGPDGAVLVPIATAGDLDRSRPFREIGGKGVFCKEIEAALLEDRIDLAVHSLKDMPVEQPEGLVIACVLPRADMRDALVSSRFSRLEDMPAGSVVGTSSVRRRAQIARFRKDITVVDLRGNIDTRLRKLADGAADGLLMAMAGLERLEAGLDRAWPVPPEKMLPAPGQGAICIECRTDDRRMRKVLELANDSESMACVVAERSFLGGVGGYCDLPVGAFAAVNGRSLKLSGEVLRDDGSDFAAATLAGSVAGAAELGKCLAERLLDDMGPEFRAWLGSLGG